MAEALTTSQREFLRSAARRLRCGMTVGKAGAGESVVRHACRLLSQRELVKLRLLGPAAADRRGTAESLARAAQATLVDLVGRVVVLYRPNEQLSPERRIQLPPP